MLLLKTNKSEETFNPGDIVVGTEESNLNYLFTNKKNDFVGKVLKVEGENILVKVVDINPRNYPKIGRRFVVLSKYFTLLIKDD